MTNNNSENHVNADGNHVESSEEIKPTYNVMTVDVSETYYPPIDDSSKCYPVIFTYVRTGFETKPTYPDTCICSTRKRNYTKISYLSVYTAQNEHIVVVYFAAKIVHSCQQYCSGSLHLI